MRRLRNWVARNRITCALPAAVVLTCLAQPAYASSSDAQSQVNNAQQNLSNAQNQAKAEDRVLANAQASLEAAAAQLNALQARISVLDAAIAGDTATVQHLNAQLAADRDRLATYVRQAYENGGSQALIAYIVSAKDIPSAMQRKAEVDHVAGAAQQLIDRINDETARAQQTLAADNAARAQLATAQEQARTQQAIVAVQEQQVAAADAVAHQAVGQAQAQLTAAQAALAAARAADVVYAAVQGTSFTVDTDLTKPSGESADRINQVLQGTPMAGLGDSFMRAEHSFHVSARYFVAHAILESDWGSSAIAHDKHNLFGYNADDANPYQDATTFPSFDACIQYVAQFIADNYLSPNGQFFHGPTLRGMNVDYATDPGWADKIASIARSLP